MSVLVLLPSFVNAERIFSTGAELQMVQASFGEVDDITSVSAITADTTTFRSGLASWRVNPSGSTTRIEQTMTSSATTNGGYWRVYIRVASAPSGQEDVMSLCSDVSGASRGIGAGIRMNTDRTLELWNISSSSPVQIGSDSAALALDTWYRLEVYLGPGTTRNTEARINGIPFASGTITTADATFRFNGTIATNESLCSNTGNASYDWYFDDIAYNDDQGNAQNSWPGEGRIVHLRPNAVGDNDDATSTPNSYLQIDEVTPDDATTVAWMDANADLLDVNVDSPLSAGIDWYDSVTLVQVGSRQQNAVSGSSGWNLRVKSASGGTVGAGSSIAVNTQSWRSHDDNIPRVYSLTSYTDPSTGRAWKPIGINSLDNMQIGAASTDATPNMGFTTLWALVEFVDRPQPFTFLTKGRLILTKGRLIFN